MNREFQNKLKESRNEFRLWSRDHQFQRCRLISYSGVECVGSTNVPIDEVEREIEGALNEGFDVNWVEHEGTLFLCVWESLPQAPSWQNVFAEEDIFDSPKF